MTPLAVKMLRLLAAEKSPPARHQFQNRAAFKRAGFETWHRLARDGYVFDVGGYAFLTAKGQDAAAGARPMPHAWSALDRARS